MESKGISEGLWAVMKCVGVTYLGKVDGEKTRPTDGWWHLSEAYELVVQYDRTPDGLARSSFLLFTGADTEPSPTQVRPQTVQWVGDKSAADKATLDRLLTDIRKQTVEMRAKNAGVTLEKKIPSNLSLLDPRGKRG